MSGKTEVCGDEAKPGMATRSSGSLSATADLVRTPAQAGWQLSERSLRVALYGFVPDDDPTIIADMMQEIATLRALLRLHRCNSEGDMSVGECVDANRCACSCGLKV